MSFVVMAGTLAVNLGVTVYERRFAKRLRSEVLAADANHTLSDALVSVGVIAGLAAVALGFPMADPIMALVVTLDEAEENLRTFSNTWRKQYPSCVKTFS